MMRTPPMEDFASKILNWWEYMIPFVPEGVEEGTTCIVAHAERVIATSATHNNRRNTLRRDFIMPQF